VGAPHCRGRERPVGDVFRVLEGFDGLFSLSYVFELGLAFGVDLSFREDVCAGSGWTLVLAYQGQLRETGAPWYRDARRACGLLTDTKGAPA